MSKQIAHEQFAAELRQTAERLGLPIQVECTPGGIKLIRTDVDENGNVPIWQTEGEA
jgi:hypothetical protein